MSQLHDIAIAEMEGEAGEGQTNDTLFAAFEKFELVL